MKFILWPLLMAGLCCFAQAPFNSTAPTATTCVGMCQNATAEDTTIPGHIAGTNVITRITDGSTVKVSGLGGSVGNFTCSGGDNDRMISANGTYVGVGGGGYVAVYHLAVVNDFTGTGYVKRYIKVLNAGPPKISVPCSFGFSWTTDTRFYYFVGSVLHQGDITSDSTFTDTVLVDLMGPGVCPGVTPFTVKGTGILSISTDDDKFSGMLQPGAQESADWVFTWSRTQGCTTANFATGNVYAYCKAPATCNNTTSSVGLMAANSSTCWGSNGATSNGIHDTQMSGDGQWMTISYSAGSTWTQGGCTGLNGSSGIPMWGVGTIGNQWCSNRTLPGITNLICGGHQSLGVSQLAETGTSNSPQTGPTVHTNLANIATYTTYHPYINISDFHCSWPHASADAMPLLCAGDYVITALASDPHADTVWAIYPTVPNKDTYFTHTFECAPSTNSMYVQCADGISDAFGPAAAIGAASPNGDRFCWVSSMKHQLGLDNSGKPRADAFCVLLY